MGSYAPAFTIAGALALVGVVLVVVCSRLQKRLLER
jgi:heme exporter protein D